MRTSGIFNTRDLWKRILRLIDLNHSYRKILILLIIITAILWYFGPPLTMWLFSPRKEPIEGEYLSILTKNYRTSLQNYTIVPNIVVSSNRICKIEGILQFL